MRLDDGRVVSNFITQMLTGKDLTIYGNGSQTRSFCFVSDMIEGIIKMMDSNETGPINLGNPNEMTVAELADLIIELAGSSSNIIRRDPPPDDPIQRQPDITMAIGRLRWKPQTELKVGLKKTLD